MRRREAPTSRTILINYKESRGDVELYENVCAYVILDFPLSLFFSLMLFSHFKTDLELMNSYAMQILKNINEYQFESMKSDELTGFL